MNALPRWPVLLLLITIAGCTHVNVQHNPLKLPAESRKSNHTRASFGGAMETSQAPDDGYFVGLALSGGGSRSANFSAACMFELQRLGILQKVDCISSVSGGSLPAAYYCLTDADWNPGNVQRRLTHDFANDLIWITLQPWNLLAMSMTAWDRSDVLAGSFQNVLFSRAGQRLTFNELRPDRPRLLINATDLQSGDKFVFCNESFDALNSDLARYPIAHAVAASAAVPVLLHQVTLRDYSTAFTQYKHLIDGGIKDNLGVASLVESYTMQIEQAIRAGRPDPYPHGIILLVVDAHTDFDQEIGDEPDIGLIESLAAGAGLSSTVLLNRVSSATLAEIIVNYSANQTTAESLRNQIKTLEDSGTLKTRDLNNKPVRVVHLALKRVGELKDLPFVSFGGRVNNVATYFNIDPTEAYHLYKAAELLVRQKFDDPLRGIADDLSSATK